MEREKDASTEELLNPTKIIHYHKGDETYPKTDDLTKDNWGEYLFSDIYEKAVKLVYDVIDMNVISKKNQKNIESNDINNTRNNIIAFVGERGSGKTSCLQSIYYNLNKIIEKNKTNIVINNRLPIIDPSYFDDYSNILEIVVAQMFQKFKSTLSNTNQYVLCESKSYIERKRELITRFQQVKETLDCINTPNNIYASHDSIETLSRMSSSSDLESKMHELISCYLQYFAEVVSSPCGESKYNALVIAIDDLDVQAKHTYKMVEQIRKYLIQDNVVILLGVKLKQLSDLIKQDYYNDYKALLDKGDMSLNQIDDMASRYLLKLIPFSHRLHLPTLHDNTNVKLKIYDSVDNGNAEKLTIYANILELIYSKTRISFYNSLDQETLIVPHNLRELLNLVALLCELESIDNIEEKNSKNQTSEIRRQRIITNRRIFKRYFIDTWCLDKLSNKHYIFIKELVDCDIAQFNKYIVDYIYQQYSTFYDNANNIDKNMFSQHNRSYNVSMADVQTMLDTLSTYNDVKVKRLIFAIKTLYSMFLYEEYHNMKTQQSIIDSKNRLEVRLKGKLEKSWNANNKLNFLHNYERLIGGNVLNIYRKGLDKNRNLNREAYTGVVDGKKIWELYKSVQDKTYLTIVDEEKEQYKSKFNVFEFFLLSILVENSIPQYRILKHCYYDTFPINDFSEQELVFSFISIPTNILRLYRLYQIFKCYDNKKASKNIMNDKFFIFFKLIELNKEISLIYRILQINPPKDKKKQDIYRNKTIENMYINNIELIDLLENTIGFTSKERFLSSALNDLNKNLNIVRKELEDLIKARKKNSNNFNKISEAAKELYTQKVEDTIKQYKEIRKQISIILDKRKYNNISIIKSFLEKLSTFQYYSYEYSIEENISDKTFITPLKDIMLIIADLFDVDNNSKFTDLFYEIYSYNPENDN